jgi:hypothetical protein
VVPEHHLPRTGSGAGRREQARDHVDDQAADEDVEAMVRAADPAHDTERETWL